MIKNLKRWARTQMVDAVAERVRSTMSARKPELWGIAPWYQENYWEPPVQLALRDLCRPGTTVFDVGANMGGLTTLMSRLVGPRGCVLAFEASPRIVDKTQLNVAMSGCGNVQIFHNAVYSKSHETMSIYLGSHLNDSIYAENGSASAYRVGTIALDDLVKETGLSPDVVKIDIEGAEFDAIVGFQKTIERDHPHLLLETQPSDVRCLDFLRARGYRAIDLNAYLEIRTPDDYPAGTGLRNLLYIHESRLVESGYVLPLETAPVMQLSAKDWIANGSAVETADIRLPKGRYLIDIDATAEGTSNDVMCGVKVGGKEIFRYHAYSKLLCDSYRDWVIDLPTEVEARLFFDFRSGTSDPTFRALGAKIREVKCFAGRTARLCA